MLQWYWSGQSSVSRDVICSKTQDHLSNVCVRCFDFRSGRAYTLFDIVQCSTGHRCIDSVLILNISCLHLDFEHATHNAAWTIWPGIDIKGCQFLLSQSWWRKVQSLGLAAEYKNPESDVGNWIKSFFSLSYKCTWIPTMLRTVLRSTYLHVLLTWKKHMNSQITFYRIT